MDAFYKDTKKQLLDTINTLNDMPIPLGEETVLLGSATPNAETGMVEVGVRGVHGQGYRKDPVRVSYSRLDLARLFGGVANPSIRTLSQSTLHRLLPRLNKILGTRLTVDDVEDVDFSVFGQDVTVEFIVTAKPDSRFYSGSFTLTFNRRWLLLEEVVDPLVGAFVHPDPLLENKTSAGMLTWGLDFTPIAHLLTIDPTAADYRGDFTNVGALQQALADQYRIDLWPSNAEALVTTASVKDYSTSEVDRANRDFQRVVVQTNIDVRGYIGTAYFHYNLT